MTLTTDFLAKQGFKVWSIDEAAGTAIVSYEEDIAIVGDSAQRWTCTVDAEGNVKLDLIEPTS